MTKMHLRHSCIEPTNLLLQQSTQLLGLSSGNPYFPFIPLRNEYQAHCKTLFKREHFKYFPYNMESPWYSKCTDLHWHMIKAYQIMFNRLCVTYVSHRGGREMLICSIRHASRTSEDFFSILGGKIEDVNWKWTHWVSFLWVREVN